MWGRDTQDQGAPAVPNAEGGFSFPPSSDEPVFAYAYDFSYNRMHTYREVNFFERFFTYREVRVGDQQSSASSDPIASHMVPYRSVAHVFSGRDDGSTGGASAGFMVLAVLSGTTLPLFAGSPDEGLEFANRLTEFIA